jgi:hypothetical protein
MMRRLNARSIVACTRTVLRTTASSTLFAMFFSCGFVFRCCLKGAQCLALRYRRTAHRQRPGQFEWKLSREKTSHTIRRDGVRPA